MLYWVYKLPVSPPPLPLCTLPWAPDLAGALTIQFDAKALA